VKRLLIFLLALAAPLIAPAAGEKVYRLAELEPTAASLELTHSLTLPELAKLGFSEGRNLVLDARVGDAAAMAGMARELVLADPDAIIAVGPDATRAARQATTTVPLVVFGPDPVRSGWATSLAHPGGNVTGVTMLAVELDGKRLDLLHEAVPAARRVAALLMPSVPGQQPSEREMRDVAASDGVDLLIFDATGPEDYRTAFAAMRAVAAQGLVIMANPTFYRDAALLARLAIEAGLPTVCEWAEMAQSGCLLGYGPNRPEMRRRLAHFVAHIFQGAAPGDLPIEQPTHYEFVVNLKTAEALGLTVPPSILARADEVIE
jgi:putative tryptophan/tyrosine transport system substrate-binding protein